MIKPFLTWKTLQAIPIICKLMRAQVKMVQPRVRILWPKLERPSSVYWSLSYRKLRSASTKMLSLQKFTSRAISTNKNIFRTSKTMGRLTMNLRKLCWSQLSSSISVTIASMRSLITSTWCITYTNQEERHLVLNLKFRIIPQPSTKTILQMVKRLWAKVKIFRGKSRHFLTESAWRKS